MKLQIMSLLTAAIVMTSCSTTQTSTSSNAAYGGMPTAVRTDFERHYPDATNIVVTNYDAAAVPIDWELTDWSPLDASDYLVTFNMGNDKYYAWYDANGTWVGSAYALEATSILPSAVTTTLHSQFNGYTIESLQKETWRDRMAYELKLVNGDKRLKVLVDANGTVIKQKDK
jgi:hypothetical protein